MPATSHTSDHRNLLTTDEAATYLNVTPRMVRRLVQECRIPVIRIGRHVRLKPEHVEEYLRNQTSPALRSHSGR